MSRMILGLSVSALSALTLAGCITTTKGDDAIDDVDPADGSGSGGDPGPKAEPIKVREGWWLYAEVTPVSSTCRSNTPIGEPTSFVIDEARVASFRIVPGFTDAFSCTLDGAKFQCPSRLTHTEDYGPGIAAVLAVETTSYGAFRDGAYATGRQISTVTCSGAQCATLTGTFPCKVTSDIVVRAR